MASHCYYWGCVIACCCCCCWNQAVLQTLLGPTFAVFACALALEEVGGLQVSRPGARLKPDI